jgi:hypothetical protein
LISRDQYILQSTGQTVAHQFHIATLEHPDIQNAVSIAGPQPACGCPEFRARPGFCCQHILFVYIHVLKHPNASTIYQQMGGGSSACRLVPPIPKPGEICCSICFNAMGPSVPAGLMDMSTFSSLIGESSSAGPAAASTLPPIHPTCLDAWRKGIVKHLVSSATPVPRTPADLDVSQRKFVQADAGTLISVPVKII